ncbi:NAD(P)/FAD-dependent oxidoreductase [Hyphomicrobium sp.]|jgi:NADPH-dependent 2,4-dienoyl-CoA reductase/sulfur reductase-like enzyme|uniref:NAD(P)/FAD-dependent oxidoreductase n=1 Tax=Hyphomicrobium sp. TaxID=82 RepID=UPI0035663597
MSAPFDVRSADVLIIGAGPAGLSAATHLKRLGVGNVMVVEREPIAGGIPRHCGHPPFGMREFGLVLTGPAYARRLVDRAVKAGVELQLKCSVVSIDYADDLIVTCASNRGPLTIVAKRVIVATGVRERPRSARLISGERPLGILNTGALQEYVYLQHLVPFRRPVIVGTELVSLSSLLTCRKIGAKPVAMIESRDRPTVRRVSMALPRLLGVPVRYGTRIADIKGRPRVEAVTLRLPDGSLEDVACDGVVFTGSFRPESALARSAGLEIDGGTGGPVIDQFARTSEPRIFAAGNVLHPVETAGWSWREGRRVGAFVAQDLDGKLSKPEHAIKLTPGTGIRYVVPQRLVPGGGGFDHLQLRAACEVSGVLVAHSRGRAIRQQPLTSGPERRILAPLAAFSEADADVIIGVDDRPSTTIRSGSACV